MWVGNPIKLDCNDHCTTINVINSLRKIKNEIVKKKKKKKKKKKTAKLASPKRLPHAAKSLKTLYPDLDVHDGLIFCLGMEK